MIWLLELELVLRKNISGNCRSSSKLKVVCRDPEPSASGQSPGTREAALLSSTIFVSRPADGVLVLTGSCLEASSLAPPQSRPFPRGLSLRLEDQDLLHPPADHTHLCKRSCWGVSLHLVFWCRF